MAGHEWEDWFEREELIGQISDIRVQNLQVERESVQKRTFTRWMNLHLEKCNPPIEVNDLFRDIQDGHVLMALLEELSGCKLLHGFKRSSHRIFRLNNIAKVLSFLEERNVKLVSIDAADVADGNASIVLGLIWNIILFFQIKELTGNIRSQFPSCSSLSSLPTSSDSDASSTPSDERERQSAAHPLREHSRAIKKLLQWVQRRTRKYGVAVQDFGKSWTSGLAFLAVIKSIDSSLVDMRKALLRTPRENLEDAFRIAHYSLGIPRLLEPEDVTLNTPDEQSIMMYVSQFLEHFPGIEEPEEPLQVIERSVSMGRLNFRETDMDHFRNGHKGRVRERSYMFQKDSTAPPPKILISSVSEDRGIASPLFRQAAKRSWSTEDFLSEHNLEEEKPSKVVDEPQKEEEESSHPELQSTELRDSHSPTDSALPESIIGDSNISSPDSWIESEYNITPEKFCESQSDSSIFDSGTAWDVYRATPVELTNSDEGLAPSEDARLSDEQNESYIDEGICSLTSLECAQDRVNGHGEKKGREVKSQEANIEMQDGNDETRQTEFDVVGTEQDHSMVAEGLNGVDNTVVISDSTDQDQSMVAGGLNGIDDAGVISDSARPSNNEEESSVSVLNEQCSSNAQYATVAVEGNVQNEQSVCPKMDKEDKAENRQDNECAESKESKSNSESKSKIEDDVLICEDAEKNTFISREARKSLGNAASIAIPLISISTEPDDQGLSGSDTEEHHSNEDLGQEVTESKESSASVEFDFESNEKVASCFITENIDLIASEELSDFKNGEQFEIVEPSNGKEEYVEIIEDTQKAFAHSNLDLNEPEMVILINDHQDELCSTLSATETLRTQKPSVDMDEHNGNIVSLVNNSSNTNQKQKDYKRPTEELVDLEPMDLFYPDKEEPIYTEPSEVDVQSWPSVLSVSPLQPAPASEDLSDEQSLTALEEDVEAEETTPESHASAMDTQECLVAKTSTKPLCKGEGTMDVRADHSSPSVRDDTDPMRSFINNSSGQDGNQIPPVLRHRKGARFAESTDNQRSITSEGTTDPVSENGLLDSWEVYVILVLWLLLYLTWVLPPMDAKELLFLFFNVRP